jgi:diadenosine tetraphosphate (Ap4A) HIT family hydrolase
MDPLIRAVADFGGEQRVEHCVFCDLVALRHREIVAENSSFVAVFDDFPVNEGHILIISKRHIESPFQLLNHEGIELLELLRATKSTLDQRFRPDGYNIGVNCGEAAGQTVRHLHVHLIPRYKGDVENPRGGIRNFKSPLGDY